MHGRRIINAKYGAHNYIIVFNVRATATGESNFGRENDIFYGCRRINSNSLNEFGTDTLCNWLCSAGLESQRGTNYPQTIITSH